MATIAVGVTGLALSAAAGAPLTVGVSAALFAAGLAAAYVDAAFILPALLGAPKLPSKLGDLQLQTTEVGAQKPITYGTKNRLAGQLIWASDLYTETLSVGGGKSGEVVQLKHFVDVAIAIAEREIGRVEEIIVDGELIFDFDPTYSETGTLNPGTPQAPGKLNIWYVPQIDSRILTVTNATNATPIVITTSVVHGLVTGVTVTVTGVVGNTAANTTATVTVLTTTTFELDGTVGNGAYVSGGQAEVEKAIFVPLAEGASRNGLATMGFARADMIISSDPDAPPNGSGVDFSEVRTGKSLKMSGGTFGAGRTYTALSVSRGQSPAGGSKGQSVMRLDIRSEGTRTSGSNPESYGKNLPNTTVIITAATIPPSFPVNMSITVGAGHGVVVSTGKWLHFDLIWRNFAAGADGGTIGQVEGNFGRGLAGGPYWAVAISTTVLDLFDVDKTTRIQCFAPAPVGSPAFPGNTNGYIINDDATAASYSFDQSTTIGPFFTEQWKINVRDTEEFFLGKANETVLSTIISAREGAENVPLHNRNAFVVIKKLAIGNWGNRIPSFSFIVTREVLETYGTAILDICSRVGLGAGRVTVEGTAATEELQGYVIEGIVDAQRALQPLAIAGDIVAIETGDGTKGILQFFKRLEAPSITLDMNLVGARASGEQITGQVEFDEVSDKELAKQIWLLFQDGENSLQQGVVGFMRNDDITGTIPVTSEKTDTINLPMTLNVNQAQGIVQRMFTRMNINRKTLTFTLGPKYLYLRENYRLLLRLKGRQYWCRVIGTTMGVNHLLEVETVLEDVYTDSGGGSEDAPESNSGRSAPDFIDATVPSIGSPHKHVESIPTTSRMLAFAVVDLPALKSEQVRQLGVYFTASRFTDIEPPGGYQLFRRRKGHGRFIPLGESTALSPYGFTRGESFGTGVRDVFDLSSELIVEISSGEDLVTRTEAEVLEGCNRAAISGGAGVEMVAYVDVELLRVEYDARIYKLTKLLRGIKETPINDLSQTGRFILLNPHLESLGFDLHSTGDIGETWEYKAVPSGLAETDIDPIEVVITGNTIRPRAVAHLEGEVDGSSNDLTVSWLRRSRSVFRLLSGQSAPLDESFLGFKITIVDKALGTLYRTFTPVEVTPSIAAEIRDITYTAAQQTTDGSGGKLVVVTVIQLSDIVEGGFPSSIEVQL